MTAQHAAKALAHIRYQDWLDNRHLFTEAEKDVLNAHIVGEVVCPRMIIVTLNEQTASLIERMEDLG